MKSIIAFSFFLFTVVSFGQTAPAIDKGLEKKIKKHIVYLASKKLEGRGTGTKGNELAASYLEKEFKKIGLSVDRQPFEVTTSVTSIPQKVEIILPKAVQVTLPGSWSSPPTPSAKSFWPSAAAS